MINCPNCKRLMEVCMNKDNYYYKKRQKTKFPERIKAREMVHNSLKSGKLIRPSRCQECKWRDLFIEAHHEDYNQPLKVEWLCKNCHRERHR